MAINKERAEKTMKMAEREFRIAVTCLEDNDCTGSLKYLQECMEYAVKAVLIAYGIDYPKIHAVGRFLYVIKEKYPQWFLEQVETISEVNDSLARERPKFRYPYEHPPEQYERIIREILPKIEKALESCRRLIKELFS